MNKLLSFVAVFVLTGVAAAVEQAPPINMPAQAPPVIQALTAAAPAQAPPVEGCGCGGAFPCECGPTCNCKSTGSYRSIMPEIDQPAQAPKTGAVSGHPGWYYEADGSFRHKESGWSQSAATGLYFHKSAPGIYCTWEALQSKYASDCANGQCDAQGASYGGQCGPNGCGTGVSSGGSYGTSYGMQGSNGGYKTGPLRKLGGFLKGRFGKGGCCGG